MYYPIQIPYILNPDFAKQLMYSETVVPELGGFVICIWQISPRGENFSSARNIIVTDGCIDLVAHLDTGRIGFVGMSKTEFDYKIELPARSFGARMSPGAFHQLTGLPATAAMDAYLPLSELDRSFDQGLFFSLPFEEAKAYFTDYLRRLTAGKTADGFTRLFDRLSENQPESTEKLYELLHFSPRQCQRLFKTHFGITPKLALSILRFQRCLEILTSGRATPADVLLATNYYDQPHLIRDFKSNLGITPLELIRMYRN